MSNTWLAGPLRQSMVAAAEGRHDDSARLFEAYRKATLATLTKKTGANPEEATDECHDKADH